MMFMSTPKVVEGRPEERLFVLMVSVELVGEPIPRHAEVVGAVSVAVLERTEGLVEAAEVSTERGVDGRVEGLLFGHSVLGSSAGWYQPGRSSG
jgi:hypothetical protein